MAIAQQGDTIVCSQGHACGRILRDVPAGDILKPEDISLSDAGKHDARGHFCPTCEERITVYRNGAYSVRTCKGWAG